MSISFSSFMAFCKTLEGQTLPTKGGNANFVLLSVKSDRLFYHVISTGNDRRSTKRWIEDVLNHYSKTGSLRPVDYVHITTNASYTLTLLDLFLKHQSNHPPSSK